MKKHLWGNEMDNIEIKVTVNGKEVPLDTISTETFKKVKKALGEPEIDVTRITYVKEFELGTRYHSWDGKIFRYVGVDYGMFGTMKIVVYEWIQIR